MGRAPLVEVVASRLEARVYKLELRGSQILEMRLATRYLEDSRPPINDRSAEVLELRRTLATRAAQRRSRRRRPDRLD
jgi:hypothetical protein